MGVEESSKNRPGRKVLGWLGICALCIACSSTLGGGGTSSEDGSNPEGSTPGSTPTGTTTGSTSSGPTGTGASGDTSGTATPSNPGTGGEAAGGASATGSTAAGEVSGRDELTRLTRAEYAATLRDAFGHAPGVSQLPEDGRIGVFTSNATVTPDPVHPYLLAAEEFAADAVPSDFPACNADEARECIDSEYRAPLSRLYRRSLTDDEIDTLAAMLGQLVESGATAEQATRTMLASALVGPDFLYRASPANTSGAVARRLGERMSYALWDAPPDDELSAALVGDPSDLGNVLAEQSRRLALDERAVDVVARFLAQWLEVDTDLRQEDQDFATAPEFVEWTALVRSALDGDTSIQEIFTSETGFVEASNADLYGLDDVDADDGEVVALPWPADGPRRGILSQELIAGSSRHPDASRRPIFRGLLVRRALLCDEIPAPSADLVALAGEVEDRTQDARCAGCHLLLDPIGMAFGALDPGADEAPSAVVSGHTELDGTYEDLPALLSAVAESSAFAECFSRHWLGFFLEQELRDVDDEWVARLADEVRAGAGLLGVVEHTARDLATASETFVPWCEGQ